MSIKKNFKRGFFHFWNFPRFYFCIFVIIIPSYSQSDSDYVYRLSAGANYFDLFRQRSENSRTTVFSKHMFAAFSAASGSDSLSLSYHTTDQYASVNQKASRFSSSIQTTQQNLDLSYANAWSFFNYNFAIGTSLNNPSPEMNYSISIAADPFDRILTGEITVVRAPVQYNSEFLFQDFYVPLREDPLTSNIFYTIHSEPFEDFSTTIEYNDGEGMNDNRENGYEVHSNFRSIGKNLVLRYSLDNTTDVTSEIETDEFRTELTFRKNALSFGDLVKGNGKYSHYSLTVNSNGTALPLRVKYTFDQFSLSGLGHFESWPFTSLAASIITNRLNYQMSGFIKHHSLEATADFQFRESQLSASLSYHRVIPDAFLEHWEPEFLVFGMKNFTRNPFSINDIHLAGVKLHYAFPFDDFTLSAFMEQYIPLSISYREHRSSSNPQPPGPEKTATNPTTDGGRRGGIFILIRL